MDNNILLLEDELLANELLTTTLIKNGFTVISTTDGYEVLEKFDDSIDLVILDIMVPGIDGLEVMKRIRKTSRVPILLMSAKRDEVDRINGLKMGADDYISKPLSVEEVVYRVIANLRRVQEYSSEGRENKSVIKCKGLELDVNARIVLLDNKPLELSWTEYQVLKMFMENIDRVLPQERIYESVWGEEFTAMNKTVMTHISRLRGKLKGEADTEYIRTVKGLGYKMVGE